MVISGERVSIDPVIGIPVQSQLFLKLNPNIGLGINFYLNFNKEKTFGGLTFNLVIGKIRLQ